MDDQAIKPIAPQLDYTQEEEEQIASAEDQKTAEAYFHPSWQKVEQMFIEGIQLASAPIDKSLVAEEYKIQGVANELYAAKLKEMLGRVKDAVLAVEQGKQQKGGN